MRARVDCLPCVLKQILATVSRVSTDEWFQARAMAMMMGRIAELDLERSPAELTHDALTQLRSVIGASDPFAEDKRTYNSMMLTVLPQLRRMVKSSERPLGLAAKLAVAGNVIDLGILSEFDVQAELRAAADRPLAVDHTTELETALKSASTVMYILDNAGEAAVDRVFIEQMQGLDVTCVVRRSPVLNDATRADAEEVGLDKLSTIVDPGAEMLGVVPALSSPEFRKLFREADVVIAKGQANYETLDECERGVFFLLKAKCPVVAGVLSVAEGQAVVLFKPGRAG